MIRNNNPPIDDTRDVHYGIEELSFVSIGTVKKSTNIVICADLVWANILLEQLKHARCEKHAKVDTDNQLRCLKAPIAADDAAPSAGY